MSPPSSLPPPDRAALLLDLDGTLLDIAPRPDAVVVPPGLTDALRSLRERLGGALAVVSGRPVAQIDALLGDAPYAVAGEHGSAIRHAPGAVIERADYPSLRLVGSSKRLASRSPIRACFLEHKDRGFVLSLPRLPELGAPLRDALVPLLADSNDFVLMPARKAWEVSRAARTRGSRSRA